MNKRNLTLSLLIVPLGALLTWLLLSRPATGIDDADIFFVYANHFADGHGFVYNIGGERVEGFTSMLWTLICSGFAVVFHSIEKPLLLLNVVLGVAAISACLKRAERPGLFLVALAAAPAWFAWCQITLMETGLWCLIITLLGLAVAERRVGAVSALIPLMVLTRPESMLWGAWAVLLIFLLADAGRRIKTAAPPLLAYLITLVALVGFRMAYFGHPVPNTYYAKVSPSLFANLADGMGYLVAYALSGGMVALLLLVSTRSLVRGTTERARSFWLALFLLPGLGIPVLVGGDHFGAFRFYQPLWPLLCLLAANELPALLRKIHPAVATFALLGLLAAGWMRFPLTANLKHEFRIAAEGRANGAALSRMFQDLERWPSVAVITAGGNKLAYPGPVFDLMGLNDTEMARAPGDAANFKNHAGFNREVFYRWRPDIVLRGDSAAFDARVLNGLHDEPRFRVQYLKCSLHRNGAELNAWFSNDLLTRLPAAD